MHARYTVNQSVSNGWTVNTDQSGKIQTAGEGTHPTTDLCGSSLGSNSNTTTFARLQACTMKIQQRNPLPIPATLPFLASRQKRDVPIGVIIGVPAGLLALAACAVFYYGVRFLFRVQGEIIGTQRLKKRWDEQDRLDRNARQWRQEAEASARQQQEETGRQASEETLPTYSVGIERQISQGTLPIYKSRVRTEQEPSAF